MNKNTSKITVDMINGNIIYSLILFIIPICISLICQQLYNTIDTMVVGHYLGEKSLAAVGSATPIYILLLSFCFGMGNGLSIVTGRSFGSGDQDLLKKTVVMSVLIAIVTAIVLTFIGQVGSNLFLQMTNTPLNIIDESRDYIYTITKFMVVMVFYNLSSSLLKAIGNSIMPLVFLMVSSVINVVLDILLITQFHLGVKGAAIATVIAQTVSVILCIIYILKKVPILIPERIHFKIDKLLLKEMVELSLSMGFMNSIVSIGTVILQSAINNMGSYIIAGHTIARNIFTFTTIPITAISTSMATFSSQNYGANKPDRIREAIRDCFIASIILSAIVTICMVFFGENLIRIISGSSNEIIVNNGKKYIIAMGPFFISLGALTSLRVTLQGVGEKFLPLLSSVIELIVKILFTVLLIPVFKYNAVIFCEPFAWTIMAIELIISFKHNNFINEKKSTSSTG